MNIQTLIRFLGISLLINVSVQGKTLEEADSLYAIHEYTSAFSIYDSLFSSGFASESMILKMGLIAEGSGNYPGALFYLSFYEKTYGGDAVEKKISEIAEEHDLEGYNVDDIQFLRKVFFDYFEWILAVLFLFSALLAVLIIVSSIRRKQRAWSSLLLMLTLGAGIYVLTFYERSQAHPGIIMAPKGYLMEGPSAGSEVMEPVAPGEKVYILGKTDYWLRVERSGVEGYLRENQVWELK